MSIKSDLGCSRVPLLLVLVAVCACKLRGSDTDAPVKTIPVQCWGDAVNVASGAMPQLHPRPQGGFDLLTSEPTGIIVRQVTPAGELRDAFMVSGRENVAELKLAGGGPALAVAWTTLEDPENGKRHVALHVRLVGAGRAMRKARVVLPDGARHVAMVWIERDLAIVWERPLIPDYQSTELGSMVLDEGAKLKRPPRPLEGFNPRLIHTYQNPAVAAQGRTLAVAFTSRRGGVQFAQFSEAGKLLGEVTVVSGIEDVAKEVDVDSYRSTEPTIARTPTGYAVAWNWSGVRLALLDRHGSVRKRLRVAANDARPPVIAVHDDGIGLAWVDAALDHALWFAFATESAVKAPRRVGKGRSANLPPGIGLAVTHKRFLLTWETHEKVPFGCGVKTATLGRWVCP